jgi:Ser/Thr protein kinase RdoA (MazF antagonist)
MVHYLKSHLRSADISAETVEAVLSQYGLTPLRPPENLPLSRRTQNVVVRTPAGKMVLKRYRDRLNTASIQYGHSILIQLARSNFPAPRLVLSPAGESFVRYASSHYGLYEYMQGINYSMRYLLRPHRLKLMSLAGQTLARLHRQLEGFQPEGEHHLGFVSYTDGWRRDIPWFRTKVEELTAKSSGLTHAEARQHADWMVRNSHAILEELDRLDALLANVPLPRVIIHGDYGLHNLIFHSDSRVTPMDFESSRLEWRFSDLVSCLSRLRLADGAFDFENMGSLMRAYQQEFPLTADEWQFLPLVWRFYKLRSSLIYWNSYFETGGPLRKLISSRNAVSQADWVMENPVPILDLNPILKVTSPPTGLRLKPVQAE